MDTINIPKYPQSLLKHLYSLQQDNVMCDIQLSTEEGALHAHRLVLMAASSFLTKRVSNSSEKNDLIHFEKVPLTLLKNVVCFMYTGTLTVSQHGIDEILDFCTDLGLHDAVKACNEYKTALADRQCNDEGSESIHDSEDPVSQYSKTLDHVTDNSKENVSDEAVAETSVETRKRRPPWKRLKQDSMSDHLSDEVNLGVSKPKRRRGRPVKTGSKVIPRRPATARKAKASKVLKNTSSETGINGVEDEVLNERDVDRVEGNVTEEGLSDDLNDAKECTDKGFKEKEISPSGASSKGIHVDKHKQSRKKIETGEVHKHKTKLLRKGRVKLISKKEKTSVTSSLAHGRQRKRFPCSICPRILSSHKRLVFHEFSKHGTPYDKEKYAMFPCKEEGCKYVAADRRSLDVHMRSRHGVERPHICEFCGKSFKLPNVLATHLNIHTNKKVWRCVECDETFNQQSGLDIHVKRHHMGESSWGELCHLCSEKFLLKAELVWHLFKTHDQPLPDKYKAFTCDICGYKSRKTHDFQRHTNAHAGIKQFSCSICGKGCSTRSELKRHMMFHGEKKFKCTFTGCTYACTDSIGLSKHIRLMHTHKGYKPFGCPVCSYRTSVKGNLDKHIRTVHNLEVVTKHTIPLKMKYSNFESGDIITKDGQLVATAQDRKRLQQCTPVSDPPVNDSHISKESKQLSDNSPTVVVEDSQAAQGLIRDYLVQQEQAQAVLQQQLSSAPSDSSCVSMTQPQKVLSESINTNVVPLSDLIYIPSGVPLVAQDLRVSLGNQSHETVQQSEIYSLHQNDMYTDQ